MPRPAVPFARRTLARLTAAALSAALAVTTCALPTRTEVVPAAARTSNTNPVTPGNFTDFVASSRPCLSAAPYAPLALRRGLILTSSP